MARITSGKAKGIKLEAPNVKGIKLVQDIVKQAAFSILQDKVIDAECLDLYAGAGSFGLEALSRGAKSCDFVDITRSANETIRKNLKKSKLKNDGGEVIINDVLRYVGNTEKTYDLIFVDPFYDELKHRFLFKNLEEILNENGVIIFTHAKDMNMQKQIEGADLEIYTQRSYGASVLSIIVQK